MNRQEPRAQERKARKELRKELKAGTTPLSALIEESTPQSEPAARATDSATATPPARREPIVLTAAEAAMFPHAAKLIANYNNAQKSTGPRTPEGKATSSKNNFRHGLRGAFLVLPNEDKHEFDDLLANLRDEHEPATQTEEILVQQMAEHFWLTRRAKGFQDTMLLNPETFTSKMMNLWMRYETQHQRAFHKCLSDLLKLRAERRKADKQEAARTDNAPNGFERKNQPPVFAQPRQRVATAQSEGSQTSTEPPKAAEIRSSELTKEQAA